MDTLNQTTIKSKSDEAHPSLGKALEAKPGTREFVENLLEELKGEKMTKTFNTLQGTGRGNHYVILGNNREYNELTVKLYDSPRGKPIATKYINKGHTTYEKAAAAEELRGLVRAYLCR